MLRGDVPLRAMAWAMPGAVKSAATFCLGPLFVPSTPWAPLFFRDEGAQAICDAVNIPVGLVGGVTSLRLAEAALAGGFAFVQMARALIHNPSLVSDMKAAADKAGPTLCLDVGSGCIHCNACVVSTLDPNQELSCPIREW